MIHASKSRKSRDRHPDARLAFADGEVAAGGRPLAVLLEPEGVVVVGPSSGSPETSTRSSTLPEPCRASPTCTTAAAPGALAVGAMSTV